MPSETPDPREDLGAQTARDRAVSGVAVLAGRGALIYAFGIVANIALARLLTPRDFGLVALGTVLVVVGTYMADGGMGAALIRRAEPPEPIELAAVTGLQLALATAVAVIGTAVALPFGRDGLVVAVMLASLPIGTVRLPATIVLERKILYRPIALVDLVDAIAYYAWALGTVALGFGVWGLASAVVVRAAAGSLLMIRVGPLGFVRPRWSWHHVRPIAGFGARLQANAYLVVARDQAINVAVAAVGGIATLGVWSLAWRVLQVPTLILTTAVRVMFPLASRTLRAGEDARPLIERSIRSVAVALAVVLVGVVGSAPVALPALLGDEWADVPATLLWSGLGLIVSAPVIASTLGYLYAVGHVGTTVRGLAVQAILWPAVTVALVPSLGATAVGVASIPASIALAAIIGRRAGALSGAAILRSLAGPALAAIAAGAAGWLVAEAGPETLAWGAVALIAGELFLLAALAILARAALTETYRMGEQALRRSRTPEAAR